MAALAFALARRETDSRLRLRKQGDDPAVVDRHRMVLENGAHRFDRHHTALKRLAKLQTGPLSFLTIGRFTLGTLGGIVLPWMMLQETEQTSASTWVVLVSLTFGLSLAGELAERTLFFMTAVAPRMPGAVRT